MTNLIVFWRINVILFACVCYWPLLVAVQSEIPSTQPYGLLTNETTFSLSNTLRVLTYEYIMPLGWLSWCSFDIISIFPLGVFRNRFFMKRSFSARLIFAGDQHQPNNKKQQLYKVTVCKRIYVLRNMTQPLHKSFEHEPLSSRTIESHSVSFAIFFVPSTR